MTDDAAAVSPTDLIARILAFLRLLAAVDSFGSPSLAPALQSAGLDDVLREGSTGDDAGTYRSIHLTGVGAEDPDAVQRRLRTAITREFGKPTGTDKRWDVGAWSVSARCGRRGVSLSLRAQFSMVALRRAAVAWLDGSDLTGWLVDHGFVDAGAAPDEDGRWPRSERSLTRATIRSRTDGTTRVQFFMEPGVRPPGTTASNDDERYEQVLTMLTEALGEPRRSGAWRRGSRSFWIRRMRTYTRAIEFGDAPAGLVVSPFDGATVTIDVTPEPQPAAAAALLARLASLRGMPVEEARARLVADGVAAAEPPRHLGGTTVLLDPLGREIEFGVLDGRIARSIVQVAPETPESSEAISAAFTEVFGQPSELWSWSVGTTQVISFANLTTGASSFERYRGQVAEATRDAVAGARAWLFEGAPLTHHQIHDDWYGRCLGAAISAEVVPAVAASRPIWSVDERLLWLESGHLIAAAGADRPAWGAAFDGAGGTMAPISGADLGRFADLAASWQEPRVSDIVDAATGLGWATTDPDTRTPGARGHLTLRLRRPGEGSLVLRSRGSDEALISWTLSVARYATPEQAAEVRRASEAALARYGDPERTSSWRIGAFQVRGVDTHVRHRTGYSLEATMAASSTP